MITPSPPAADPLAALPGYALRRAAHAMMGELAARLAPLRLRVSEASVMLLIADRTDLHSAEIGKLLDIQRANMVPLLARMEQAGLIRRAAIDGKARAILLSEAGRARLGPLRAAIAAFEAGLLARIPPAHRAHFLPALLALWQGQGQGHGQEPPR